MGTRADLYVGRGKQAEWIGSIGWDGYPLGNPNPILTVKDENEYRAYVASIIKDQQGAHPEQGWPWPWPNSHLTDYSYAFDVGQVFGTCFGHGWWDAWDEQEGDEAKTCEFPEFSTENFAKPGDPRSGMISISINPE